MFRPNSPQTREIKLYIIGFQDISPDQYRLAQGTNWKTFIIYGFGQMLETNAKLAPRTAI